MSKFIVQSNIYNAIKSVGSDCILNEYFIECVDILSSHVCDIFNNSLVSDFFPEKWTQGVIIPLHKKALLMMLITTEELHLLFFFQNYLQQF